MSFINKYNYHVWTSKGFCVTCIGLQPLLDVLDITWNVLYEKIGSEHDSIVKFNYGIYKIFPERVITKTQLIKEGKIKRVDKYKYRKRLN